MKKSTREYVRIDTGGVFCVRAAQTWAEKTYFDGQNHISLATRSQWEHERVYLTRKGAWVLCEWSDWQGTGPATYTEISRHTAKEWLAEQGHPLSGGDIAEIER